MVGAGLPAATLYPPFSVAVSLRTAVLNHVASRASRGVIDGLAGLIVNGSEFAGDVEPV